MTSSLGVESVFSLRKSYAQDGGQRGKRQVLAANLNQPRKHVHLVQAGQHSRRFP